MINITNFIKSKSFSTGFMVLVIALIASAGLVTPARANQDPVGCSANGVGLSLSTFRVDGTTPISGADTVESGEIIKYGATLSNLGLPNCNFEGGNLDIITPDGATHTVASGAGIPLVTFGVPFIAPLQDYVVSEVDVNAGILTASADYSDGISHTGNTHDTAAASVNINVNFQDIALEVTKTADPAAEETYRWTINKTVNPDVWNLFDGDTGTSEYIVEVEKILVGTTYSVSGTISIHNPAAFADAVITDIADVISGYGAADTIDCGVAFPYNLAPGADLVCDYDSSIPDNAARTNTATVTTSGDVDGGSDEVDFDPSQAVLSVLNGEIEVTDTNDGVGPWQFSDSGSVNYDQVFDCSQVEYVNGFATYTHDNTATITDGDSDDASVVVNCYQLSVSKDANTSFDRQYMWDVTKTGSDTTLTLAEDELYTIDYTVTAQVTGSQDSNWAVSGDITVNNPSPMDAVINSLSDVITNVDPGDVTVDCGGAVFPYTLTAGSSLDCTYSADLPDGDAETNTATATQQNYDYDHTDPAVMSGTTDYQGSADVTFGEPANVIDEEVEVTDSYAGLLGTATVDESPKDFNYSRDVIFEGDEACGEHLVDNTATIITNDTQTQDSDSWDVTVTVTCEIGCTLTQGYWKTHNASFWGGAPVDDTWSLVGDWDESTVEMLEQEELVSGLTWFDAFWEPVKGRVWFQLAHQWMAAYLNTLSGASTPSEVDAALTDGWAWLESHDPDEKIKGQAANEVRGWASTLGAFNEGAIGPGHCDENLVQ